MPTSETVQVSVVMPTRNRAELVGRSVRNLLTQRHPSFEIVVVDDGSTDGTAAAMAQIDDNRVRYLRQESAGVSAARNAGAAVAAGEVLAFLDDDDEVADDWLDRLATPMLADDGVELVSGASTHRRPDGSVKPRPLRNLGPAFGNHRAQFDTGTYAVRSSLFESVGRFAVGLASGEHHELGMRLLDALDARATRIVLIDEPVVTIVQRPSADRSSSHPRHQYESAMYMLSVHRDRLERSPRLRGNYLAIAGVAAVRLRDDRQARHLLWQALRANPSRPKHYWRVVLISVPPLARRVWRAEARHRRPIMTAPDTSNPVAVLLPSGFRRKLISRRVDLRRVLDAARPLPGALIIGGQRCGTSSLYKWLEQHPCAAASVRKETEYLSTEFDRGEAWYRAHFSSRIAHSWAARRGRPLLSFEATPDYLLHPLAPARAASLVPDAKLIALVRDPVKRALSHYDHEVRHRLESLTFDEAVAAEEERIAPDIARLTTDPHHRAKSFRRYSYLTRGRYAEQLERWLVHFDETQLLVIRSEDMYAQPAETFALVLEFLELPPYALREFRNHSTAATRHTTISAERDAELRAYFRPHNERLEQLLGRKMAWN